MNDLINIEVIISNERITISINQLINTGPIEFVYQKYNLDTGERETSANIKENNGIAFLKKVLNVSDTMPIAYVILDLESENIIDPNIRTLSKMNVEIIKSVAATFTMRKNNKFPNIRDIYLPYVFIDERMDPDRSIEDVKTKIADELDVGINTVVVDMENRSFSITSNKIKIVYPNNTYKRIEVDYTPSHETLEEELSKYHKKLVHVVRIIKRGENRYEVHVVFKISRNDTLDKLSDFTQTRKTSPFTPALAMGAKTRGKRGIKKGSKSKKRR
jgi:hypothetical protein